jgi:hypothetical protein
MLAAVVVLANLSRAAAVRAAADRGALKVSTQQPQERLTRAAAVVVATTPQVLVAAQAW